MSKRRRQDGEEGQAANYDGRSGSKHKSLYLVLDDWHGGFTIRKLDTNNPDLSAPPVFRLASPLNNHAMDFAALGTNIIATSNRCTATVVFDTETAALAIGNPLPDALLNAVNFFVTADDTLFAFTYHFMSRPPAFEVMTTAAAKDEMMRSLCPSTDWSWESIPAPFTKHQRIVSYALHPDGRTVFVSVDDRKVSGTGTFSFDSESREWRRHGEWVLPFHRQGYFDAELDAWVGLHPDGYVCSCQVPSLSLGGSSSNSGSNTTQQQPSWKMAKGQKLWSPTHQVSKSQGATLTSMGNSRFFLVDCVVADGFEFQDAFEDPHGFVLNMTTFRLKYNHQGKLRIVDRNTTSCPVSRQLSSFAPVAFWM
ncbi:hypothetical protein CFC21_039974 [Triticum aestivum]|uniref:DUF1618 domain-containing protein n=3 Tax=Triticum TaxID=4564 RepID=A0A9R1JSG0_WHEAT|nr:uncharacterized protein LOC123064889 [Triticum aestivum]KAF7027995.1 hypothetical protein CFC21_039974 [Triticum aestivum]CDM81398.1 unnamed protein product [Triticum aestivum]VAH72917.1 unnamed protein product [Triticum turgidum subsp. durum]